MATNKKTFYRVVYKPGYPKEEFKNLSRAQARVKSRLGDKGQVFKVTEISELVELVIIKDCKHEAKENGFCKLCGAYLALP